MRNPSFLSATFFAALSFVSSAYAKTAHAATVSSSTHGGSIIQTFRAAPVAFAPYVVPGGVPAGTQLSLKDGALVLRNAYAGSFSVDTKMAAFDAQEKGHLFFDYKLAPEVKVNFFFRVNGVYHAAVFSGPTRVRPGGILLGAIADVRADNQWHRAHLPLGDWLRALYPTTSALIVDEVIIGNWDNDGYLMAGFGGNGAGATWMIDNFALVSNGPGEAKFTIQDAPAGSTWVLDGKNPQPLSGTELKVKADDGYHLLSIRDKAGAEIAAYPFMASSAAPRIGEARLKDNLLTVGIDAPGGLNTTNLLMEIGDWKFDRKSPLLRWDGVTGVLRLDAARAGFVWTAGQKVEVKLSGVRDALGRATESATLPVMVDYAAQTAQPVLPRLKLAPEIADAPADGTFENDMGGWQGGDGGAAIIERDSTTAASGRTSLRMTSPANAVPFRAWVRKTS
ncbi:MAG TPA: hypothetical protein VF719_08950, partial [Abditibacteriaceae bacterium]